MSLLLSSTDFNLSVGDAGAITEELYELEHLFGLRLCGLGIEEVPPRMFRELVALRVVSFRSNQLTTIPEDVGNLIYLTDMNLMHNRITHLPSQARRVVLWLVC